MDSILNKNKYVTLLIAFVATVLLTFLTAYLSDCAMEFRWVFLFLLPVFSGITTTLIMSRLSAFTHIYGQKKSLLVFICLSLIVSLLSEDDFDIFVIFFFINLFGIPLVALGSAIGFVIRKKPEDNSKHSKQ